MKSLSRAFVVRSVGALTIALTIGSYGSTAHATTVITSNLDSVFGGQLDVAGPVGIAGAVSSTSLKGTVTGFAPDDVANGYGSSTTFNLTQVNAAVSSFAYEYTFSVGTPSNTVDGTTYLNQLYGSITSGLSGLAIGLYAGINPDLLSAPLVGDQAGVTGSGGNVTLKFANLAADTVYTLVVTGSLAPGSTAGSFDGAIGVNPVPLPGGLLLFASGLLAIGALTRRGRGLMNLLANIPRRHGRIGAAIVAGAVMAFGLSGVAKAAALTETVNLGTLTPMISGGSPSSFTGTIVPKSGTLHLSSNPAGTATGSSTTSGSFTYDYDFTLSGPKLYDFVASLAQHNTTTTTGSQFALYSVGQSGKTLVTGGTSTVGAGPASGELLLDLSNLSAGNYILEIVGKLVHTTSSGTISGSYAVSTVPLPAAILLFGSAIVGLAAAGRRNRKRST